MTEKLSSGIATCCSNHLNYVCQFVAKLRIDRLAGVNQHRYVKACVCGPRETGKSRTTTSRSTIARSDGCIVAMAWLFLSVAENAICTSVTSERRVTSEATAPACGELISAAPICEDPTCALAPVVATARKITKNAAKRITRLVTRLVTREVTVSATGKVTGKVD